jgi:hypothetical protein
MARVGEKIYAYRALVGKSEGKISIVTSTRRREDNVMKWILKKDDGWACIGLY